MPRISPELGSARSRSLPTVRAVGYEPAPASLVLAGLVLLALRVGLLDRVDPGRFGKPWLPTGLPR